MKPPAFTETAGFGTVFAVNADGTGFTSLYSDPNWLHGSPNSLILSGNTLYGTTAGGGFGRGTVFAVNTNGTGFTPFPAHGSLTG